MLDDQKIEIGRESMVKEDIWRIKEMMKGSLEEEDRQGSSPEDLGYNRGKSEEE